MSTLQAHRIPAIAEQLLADGARCFECPMAKNGRPRQPVPTEWLGQGRPRLAIVGEAPGRREVMHLRPFVGLSGKMLNLACSQSGTPRAEMAILNAAACGPIPSGSDELKARAVAACRPRLIHELQRLAPDAVLTVGGSALRSLAPGLPSGVTVLRGALLSPTPEFATKNGPYLIPTLHPAFILRGGDGQASEGNAQGSGSVDLMYYFFMYDLAKAYRLANGKVKPWRDEADLFVWDGLNLRRPLLPLVEDASLTDGVIVEPGELVQAMTRLYDEARQHRRFSCDVETDGRDSLRVGLTAIGFATVDGGVSATWAAWQKVPAALEIARRMLAHPLLRVVFHNRIFDTSVLPRHGLPVLASVDDSLLLHHAVFPGLSHKLDQVAQQLLVVEAWKDEFRQSMRNEQSLVAYNYRDAHATALIEPVLRGMLSARGAARVYETDRQLASVATHMRKVGYWVDRIEQARHRRVQQARLDFMRKALVADFAAIEPAWRDVLARNLGVTKRKADPDNYLDRVKLRWGEIAERDKKPTDVGLFKPKATQDIIALFEVLKIPAERFTPKRNQPVTDKAAMEGAAAKHSLMRQLIHLREAQHLIATYIDIPVADDGRFHPDWSITKITGRWGAGRSQNVPKQVAGWPFEKNPDGSLKRKWRKGDPDGGPFTGDYVSQPENLRSLCTAPTVDEILALGFEHPEWIHPVVLGRALEGHGRFLFGADFGQLEGRIVALLSGDKLLLDAYNSGADVHALNAGIAFPRQFPRLAPAFSVLAAKTAYGDKKPLTLKANLGALDLLDDATRLELLKLQKPWAKMRDLAKRLFYAWIYRGEAKTAYGSISKEFPETELSAVEEAFRLLAERLTGVVRWWNEIEVRCRMDREIREIILGRFRSFPLGNYDPNVAVNFPVQSAGASLLAKSIFRFVALTHPELLQLDSLYKMQLLDPAWVTARQAEGFDQWSAPVDLLINGHDSLIGEADGADAERAAQLLELAMTHEVSYRGAAMRFTAEAAFGRRASEV